MVRELRYLLLPWAISILLPLPMLLFVHSPMGRSRALNVFFVGCLILVAASFRRDIRPPSIATVSVGLAAARRAWRERMLPLVVALFVAFAVFTIACVLFNNPNNFGTPQGMEDQGIWWRAFVFEAPRDFAAPLLALMTIVAAISIVPYFVLATRKPFAAIVFTAALVGSMKFLGAIVVVLIYGWDADEQGRLGMPWNDPDLLVWLFWGFSAVLCLSCYLLGKRRFLREVTTPFNAMLPAAAPAQDGQSLLET